MPNVSGREFSNGDTAIGIGLVVAFISTFLPWYTVSTNSSLLNFSVSAHAFDYWSGWLFFIATIAGLVLFILRSFVPQVTIPTMPQPDAVIYLVLGAFMALMAIIYLLAGNNSGGSGPGYSAGASFGLYIGLIAGIAVAVGGYLKRSEPQTVSAAPSTTGYGSFGGPSSPPPPPPA